jgi:glycosyltransferase involved in cell wall biosynthesis
MSAAPHGNTVSVVIPMHNGLPHIADALHSVYWQTRPAHELIVVDDGSTDGSAEWVQLHYPNVILLRQKQQGIAATRNRGIAAATGDWVAFLDHDDAWHPSKLEVQLKAASRFPNASVVYGDFERWLPDTEGDHKWPPCWASNQLELSIADASCDWAYSRFLMDCWMQTSSALISSKLLIQAGLFDTRWPSGEDWELWLRLSRLSPFVHIARALSLYRLHSNQVTKGPSSSMIDFRTKLIEHAIARWGYANPDGSGAGSKHIRKHLSFYHWEYGVSQLSAGNKNIFFAAMARAIRAYPIAYRPYLYSLAALIGWRPKWDHNQY